MFRKNTAGQFIGFQLLLTATGAIATGLSPAVRRCIDGTFAAGGGTVTEDTGTGGYKYAMSQADTNGNDIQFWFSVATAIPVCVNIVTTAADPTDAVRLGLTALPNAAAGANGGLPLSVDASGRVDVLKVNGTSQTAGDLQAGIVIIEGYTDTIESRLPAALVGGKIDANIGSVTAAAITAAAFAATALDAVWSTAARLLTAGTNIVLAKGVGVTGLNDLTAAQIATGVWQDATAGDFTAALSVGKSVMNGVPLGTGLTINGYTGNTAQTGDSFARLGVAGAGLTALGDTRIAHLDADVSSRSTFAGGAVASVTADVGITQAGADKVWGSAARTLTSFGTLVATVAAAVWDELIAGHLGAGKTGAALNAAGSAGDPWTTPLPGAYGAGTAGKIIGDNVNATISSRSTYAGGDTSGVTSLLGRIPAALVGGRIDANIGSVTAAAITAAAFAAAALDAVWSTATRLLTAGTNIVLAKGVGVTGLNDLDAAGVRTATGLASANLDTQLSGINSKTTNLPSDPADESLIIAATDAVMTRIGAAGAGLTALGDTRIAHLDADVSSRSTFAGGAVASVTADVGITQAGADKVWGSAARTLTSFGTLVADVATAVWGAATRVLTAGTNITLAKGVGVTGLNDLDAAGIRTATGLATANLDTQLSGISSKTTNLPATPADESLIIAATNSLASSIASLPTTTTVNAIKAKTDNLPAAPAAVSDIPTALANAAAVMASVVETGLSFVQYCRLSASALFGKASGMSSNTAVFRDTNDTKNRITATVDTDGDRTAVILDPS